VDGLRRSAQQMHLDAASDGIVEGIVIEGVGVEVGAKLAANAGDQVAVERGGHALAVVVGGVKEMRIFLEIDADQQSAGWAAQPGDAGQQFNRRRRLEIADGRSREIHHAPRRRVERWQRERAREVRLDGMNHQFRISKGQASGRLPKLLAADVHRQIRGRLVQLI